MTAPKSDTATVEARRNRLLELLSEGKTEAQAAEILREEGYPASVPTVWRDVSKLKKGWQEVNVNAYGEVVQLLLDELCDLGVALTDVAIKPERRIELALSVIDQKRRLLVPSRAVIGHVSQKTEQSPEYLECRDAFAGLSEDERHQELARVKARPRTWKPPVLDASYFPPTTRELPSAAELADPVEEEFS